MAVPNELIVSGAVKKRGETSNGWEIDIDIPEFKSKWPVHFKRVPSQIAEQLQSNAIRRLKIRRGNIKTNNGQEMDSRFYSSFFWDISEVLPAEGEPAAVAQSKTQPATAHIDTRSEKNNSTNNSIEKQVALKAAVEILNQLLISDQGSLFDKVDFITAQLPLLTQIAYKAIQTADEGGV